MSARLPDPDRLRAEAEALGPWFHNLHLPGGVETAPQHHFGDFPAFKWKTVARHLPEDPTGWRVLDIGCNAGFYSLALAARGAEVTGLEPNPHYRRQADWAAGVAGLAERTRFRPETIYQVGSLGGPFDLILFMGVFYHLRYPLLALDLIAALEPRLMVFQTLTCGAEGVAEGARRDLTFQERARLDDPDWPRMAFIETSFCDDPTNWWVPNHAGVMAILRAAGFSVTARPGHEIYLCEPSGAADAADAPAAAAGIAAVDPAKNRV